MRPRQRPLQRQRKPLLLRLQPMPRQRKPLLILPPLLPPRPPLPLRWTQRIPLWQTPLPRLRPLQRQRKPLLLRLQPLRLRRKPLLPLPLLTLPPLQRLPLRPKLLRSMRSMPLQTSRWIRKSATRSISSSPENNTRIHGAREALGISREPRAPSLF